MAACASLYRRRRADREFTAGLVLRSTPDADFATVSSPVTINDHVVRARVLVPGVMYVEAVAQDVVRRTPGGAVFEGLAFLRPCEL